MKFTTLIFGVLVACGVSYAAEHGPVLMALQPAESEVQPQQVELMLADPQAQPQVRQKRGLLLGALGAGAIGAGVVGAGVLGAGAIGAGILGAKVVGAGLIGGALASHFADDYGFYGGHGHYRRSYRTHYPQVYIVEEPYW